jgi:hypothetical protein
VTNVPDLSKLAHPSLMPTVSSVRGERHDTESTLTANRAAWTTRDVAALGVVVGIGILVRLLLLPTRGFPDDIDQFVGWVHHIATNGLGSLYGATEAGPVTFGPVMALIWGLLAAIEPAFRTATDASEPAISAIMKLPASIADVGLGLVVALALRDRPRWAVVGGAVILLHPAVIDLSAWWGQYESIYLLSAIGAAILAVNGRNGWAAVAIAVSVMTKPQALPLLLPLAAWFWATGGWREVVRATAIGSVTIVVLWLPFIADDGPLHYLRNLDTYQNDIFNILSVNAWNVWWLVQEAVAGGAFIGDDQRLLGPLTLRHLGYAVAGLLDLAIAISIVQRPTPRRLFLGLAASVLVFFTFATQMHERYAYGAVIFLALLVTEPRLRWLNVALGIVFTLNLLAAVPPTAEVDAWLSVAGVLGVSGSIAMLAITVVAMRTLGAGSLDRDGPQALPGSSPGPEP